MDRVLLETQHVDRDDAALLDRIQAGLDLLEHRDTGGRLRVVDVEQLDELIECRDARVDQELGQLVQRRQQLAADVLDAVVERDLQPLLLAQLGLGVRLGLAGGTALDLGEGLGLGRALSSWMP